MVALTGKRKDSSNSGVFIQRLFLLITGGKEKSRKICLQVTVTEFAATQFKYNIWLQEVFFSIKEMIKQFKYSLLTKHGFLLSLVRSHVLSRAVSTPWPLFPQGSPVSCPGQASRATAHRGRWTIKNNCPSETGREITEVKQFLPALK